MRVFVSITFDDGKKSHITEYYPILKKFSFRGSFYPIINQIGFSGRMDWADLDYLYQEGNEIGSHTNTHRSLTRLSEKEINSELMQSKTALKKYDCCTLSYPFGDYNEKVKGITAKYFLAARACGDIQGKEEDYGFNPEKLNKFRLKTLCLDDLDYSKYKNDKLVWLIYVIHEPPRITLDYCLHSLKTRKIGPDDVVNLFKNLKNQYSSKKGKTNADLLKLCYTLKSNSVSVVTIGEGVKFLNA